MFLSCSNQRLKERLIKRAEQQGRPDDNLKATQRRLVNFKQNAVPLVKYFQEKGLIMTVSLQSMYKLSELIYKYLSLNSIPPKSKNCKSFYSRTIFIYFISFIYCLSLQWRNVVYIIFLASILCSQQPCNFFYTDNV